VVDRAKVQPRREGKLAGWLPYAGKTAFFEAAGYEPYKLQRRVHKALVPDRDVPRTLQVIGGERAGKSTVSGMEVAALSTLCADLVFLAGASYENTEPEFEVIYQTFKKLKMVVSVSRPKQGQWQMQNAFGCEFRTISFSRDGPDALIATGKAPDIVLICEAGLVEWASFLAAYGRVAEKRGLVLLSGTLKQAQPWYSELYNQMQGDNPYGGKSISLPSWANLGIYPGGVSDPVINQLRLAYDDLTFRERFGAEPVPSSLLVFGRQFSHAEHVKVTPYDENLPVEIAVDPGYAGAYAVLVVQWSGSSDVRVIDEFYRQYATWDQAYEWCMGLPYGKRIVKGIADHAIRQHHGDKSQLEQWRGKGVELLSQLVGINEGISRMRDFLRSPFTGTPRIVIDPKCKGLIGEFGKESYKEGRDGSPIKDAVVDKSNHGRKAASYWLVWHFGRSDFNSRRATTSKGDPWKAARRQRRQKGSMYPIPGVR
jgi:hypothetical protein